MLSRCLVALFLSWPILALADSTLEYRNAADPGLVVTIQVSQGNVVMGDQSSKMLFRAGRKEIVIIDHPRRSYMVLDEATAERMNQQMGSMQQQMNAMMQQQMAQMTPEQRAQMQQLMQSGAMPGMAPPEPVETEIRRHGQAMVGGTKCENISLVTDGRVSGRMCVATAQAVGLDARDYDALLAATDAIKNMVNQMTAGIRPPMPMNLRDMKGVPVKMEDLVHGDVTVLQKHSNDKIDGAAFQLPKGYQRREMM